MGALSGIRIIEFAGIGPGPFCAMMLADHGAEVIRIDRPDSPIAPADPLLRSRRRIAIDLAKPGAAPLLRELCRTADGILEGMRPGRMERLGLGPAALLADHPKLVYGRMTGWGQTGPLAHAAGHDIDYIAIAGTLHTIGPAGGPPVPPVNYLADFGGGGMMLAFGMVAALLAVRMGGPGQVIDAAMVDGAALLSTMTWGLRAAGLWQDTPGVNLLDGGAPFYAIYRCADRRDLAVGALEPTFYQALRKRLGLIDDPSFDHPMKRETWPGLKARLAAIFATRTRDEWVRAFSGADACVAPVLSMEEAAAHPHNQERGTFLRVGGVKQPAPAPRFSATPAQAPLPPGDPGEHAEAILADLGIRPERIAQLRRDGVLA